MNYLYFRITHTFTYTRIEGTWMQWHTDRKLYTYVPIHFQSALVYILLFSLSFSFSFSDFQPLVITRSLDKRSREWRPPPYFSTYLPTYLPPLRLPLFTRTTIYFPITRIRHIFSLCVLSLCVCAFVWKVGRWKRNERRAMSSRLGSNFLRRVFRETRITLRLLQ